MKIFQFVGKLNLKHSRLHRLLTFIITIYVYRIGDCITFRRVFLSGKTEMKNLYERSLMEKKKLILFEIKSSKENVNFSVRFKNKNRKIASLTLYKYIC